MRRLRHHATRSFAALAITAIPTLALAQAAAQPNPAAEHLAAARTALNKVLNSPVPAGGTFKKLSDVKTEYLLLERAASTASPEWFAHYTTIDRLIGEVLGASSSSKEAGAVGTSGRAGGATGSLDPGIAASLQDFRTHLMAFSTAMSAVTPSAAPAAAAPTAPVPAAPDPAPPAPTPSASAAPPPVPEVDATVLLDQATALVNSALGSALNGRVPASDTVSVDRATLEQIKKQLEQLKQRMQKP